MTADERRLRALGRDDDEPNPSRDAHHALENALFEIKRALPLLKDGKDVPHAYLGVSTTQATSGGAQVGSVIANGPAAKTGLRTGDRIVEIAGTPVREPDDVAAVVNTRRPNDEVRVVVERGGQRRTLTVKLGEQPNQVSNP